MTVTLATGHLLPKKCKVPLHIPEAPKPPGKGSSAEAVRARSLSGEEDHHHQAHQGPAAEASWATPLEILGSCSTCLCLFSSL